MTFELEDFTVASEVWHAMSRRLGRNELPAVLFEAVYEDFTLTEPADIAAGVAEAWVDAEWPGRHFDYFIWAELFTKAVDGDPDSYLHDGEVRPRTDLPEKVTLWRGATEEHAEGMSWTDDRDRARWFAHRFDGMRGARTGQLWEVTVWRDGVLARFEKGRGEAEWVLDPFAVVEAGIVDAEPS